VDAAGNVDETFEEARLAVDPVAGPVEQVAVGRGPAGAQSVPSLFYGCVVEGIAARRTGVRAQLVQPDMQSGRLVDAGVELIVVAGLELELGRSDQLREEIPCQGAGVPAVRSRKSIGPVQYQAFRLRQRPRTAHEVDPALVVLSVYRRREGDGRG